MKYTRLTKEQLENLQEEFINFLATQSITGEEWTKIKEKQPEVAEEEIDIFSELVWEGALTQAKFLENISPQQLFLFSLGKAEMRLISLKIVDETKDITTTEGYAWLQKNYMNDDVEFFTATKKYENRNTDIFKLIQQGAVITKGELFGFFENILKA
ncbi:hypothetical protein ULMS_15080 [Patiriisocius marinistellae]|uniref:Histidyl-tRNA synthetase n=1 Tax=Patiriisocius marinistellae TaxID=2494560 RepID=A0A5J4FVH8_9FLAO|nr:DUF6495 family protein [Patiriisocius marinistellae]GEQ86000.1 hypothetical protein ULMS_15080 [Patiriisocius marinistellae]